MNQDSFRQLLATPRPGASSPSTSSRVGEQSTKKGTFHPSQPAFQPRKVKKTKNTSGYRDRASERRAGVNDYAQVESILEDFEQQTARIEDRDAVEEQRRYLGGDKDHTILVKGLDFALLEQNKARAAASHEDDDSLEAAFQEAQPRPIVPSKRTREDLIRQLKDNRAAGSIPPPVQESTGNDAFEDAKKVGKFRPIGISDHAKNNDGNKNHRGKEVETVSEGGKKRKRRKVKQESVTANSSHLSERALTQECLPSSSSHVERSPSQLPDASLTISNDAFDKAGTRRLDPSLPVEANEEVNIFADAGEYQGLVFDDDEDQEQPDNGGAVNSEEYAASGLAESEILVTTKSWFKENEDEHKSTSSPSMARPPTPPAAEAAPADPEQPEQVTRLAPLASSALPSISDFLAMDAQAEALKKKQLRREKKKGGEKKGKVSTELKADRDYQKLNSYLTKKAEGSRAT